MRFFFSEIFFIIIFDANVTFLIESRQSLANICTIFGYVPKVSMYMAYANRFKPIPMVVIESYHIS